MNHALHTTKHTRNLTMTPIEAEAKYLQPTYTRQPLHLTRGSGTLVRDAEGKVYIDCLAGVAVNACGHCHPQIVEAIQRQAETLIHTSNLYYSEPQVRFAEKLVKLYFAPPQIELFCISVNWMCNQSLTPPFLVKSKGTQRREGRERRKD